MIRKHPVAYLTMVMLSAITIFSACTKQDEDVLMANEQSLKAAEPKGTLFYALTSNNMLVKFMSGNPLSELSAISISGLVNSGERVLAIDFRPATGELYGVSNESRLYVIDVNTGMASAISATPFSPAIDGSQVGFDFNPTVDRIRLVTNTGQNLRLHPITGVVAATDGVINPAGSTITSVAYTNSFAGATTTTLYDIDVETDMLYRQAPPNAGTLVAVGPLGLQAVGESGFDISADNSVAIAAIFGREYEAGVESPGNKYRFYYVDLTSGATRNAGKTDREVIGVAIAAN